MGFRLGAAAQPVLLVPAVRARVGQTGSVTHPRHAVSGKAIRIIATRTRLNQPNSQLLNHSPLPCLALPSKFHRRSKLYLLYYTAVVYLSLLIDLNHRRRPLVYLDVATESTHHGISKSI